MEEAAIAVTNDYFLAKKGQLRKLTSDVSGKAFDALEIATRVLRLCYPRRFVKAVRCYYNNEPVEPFFAQEYQIGFSGLDLHRNLECVVVDAYFLFGSPYESRSEDTAFVVEVTLPVDAQRARWNVARVRWADLGWNSQGSYREDNPVPQLVGETIVNL